MEKIKVLCIPYAGGSASVYNKWKNKLCEWADLVPLEMPGRGKRFQEKLLVSMQDAVNDMFEQVKDIIKNGQKYILFGHSMGTYIAYELCIKLQQIDLLPTYAIFSGNCPPNQHKSQNLYLLSDKDFIREIMALGNTPDGFFDIPELKEIFLPILRADYEIIEKYIPLLPRKLSCNICIMGGNKDEFSIKEMKEWGTYLAENYQFEVRFFEGGHFYLFENMEKPINYINDIIEKCL